MLEILQTHTKNISTRLEAFNDGLVSSINRYDHFIQDATLRIETIIIQLKNVLKKSPLFSQESTSKDSIFFYDVKGGECMCMGYGMEWNVMYGVMMYFG